MAKQKKIGIFVPQFSSLKIKSFIVVVAICTFLCHWTALDYGGGVFMKEIQLTQGMVALVDDTDYEWLNQFSWCFKDAKSSGYAHRGIRLKSGRWTTITMHRFILGLDDPKAFVDHKDGNGLNNQRYNLRPCSNSQNRMNSAPNEGSSSRFKGVTYKADSNRWIAQIRHKKKTMRIGTFATQEIAAAEYNRVAKELFGEFAKLNVI